MATGRVRVADWDAETRQAPARTGAITNANTANTRGYLTAPVSLPAIPTASGEGPSYGGPAPPLSRFS
jgi:hypothetical protein